MANRDNNQAEKYVQLNQQQISYCAAILLLGSFFIFMAGYYWGKRYALEPITEQLISTALADKIYCALCVEEKNERVQESQTKDMQQGYYAQLGRFNSKLAAERCAQKLASLGINVHIEEQQSRSVGGIEKIVYHLISEVYSTQEELTKILSGAQKYVKVQGIAPAPVYKDQQESLLGKERHTA